MSALSDRIAEVLQVHMPNALFPSGVQCSCNLRVVLAPVEYAAHVAERIVEALDLTEETGPMLTNHFEGTNHGGIVPGRRWVSRWTAVQDQP
jgi:hypothetical protein